MASINIVLAYNTISIEKLNGIKYHFWTMKVQTIFLKNDLIVTIDGIGVDLSPTSVIVQRVGNFEKEEHL
jgi:hypothetical protein